SLSLGVSAVGDLGLAGGMHLRRLRSVATVPFQRSVVRGVEESFCRSADPGGGANDHFDRVPILLFRWRRITQPAFDFVAGYLRLGGIDDKQYSVLQFEK